MKTIIIFSLILCLSFPEGFAGPDQKNPKRFFILNPNKTHVKVPFEIYNNLIVIQVTLNDGPVLNFILDTGVGNTIITDTTLLHKGYFTFSKDIIFYGFGSDNPVVARHTTDNILTVGGIEGQMQDILFIPDPEIDFSQLLGIKIDGIIGYNLIRDFILEINYISKTLTFHAPRTYVYKNNKNSLSCPLIMEDCKPFIETQFIQEDSTLITGRFLIDTGASFALWLNLSSQTPVILPKAKEQIIMGSGLGGTLIGFAGKVRNFGPLPLQLKEVIASYNDTTLSPPFTYDDKRTGSMGADLLSRYHILLDYRHNKITFRPNSHFKDPFMINHTGLEIGCQTPGVPLYIIRNICQYSPAQLAGMASGDELVSINHCPLTDLNLSEVHALLSKPGKKMIIQYKRNGSENTATLLLTNRI